MNLKASWKRNWAESTMSAERLEVVEDKAEVKAEAEVELCVGCFVAKESQ